MTDPRELHVIGKKSEVADRTLNERKYCAIDDYYYSEMFTCPICYGAERERKRITKLVEETLLIHTDQKFFLIRAIKDEQK